MNYWVIGSNEAHRKLFDSSLSHFTGTWRYFDSPEYEVLQLAYQENPIYILVLGTKEGIPPLIRQHFKCVLFRATHAPTGTLGYWKVCDVTDKEYTTTVTDLIYNLVYHIPQEAKMPFVDGRVTVTIPVGPNEVYLQWLPECLDSVINQNYPADEIVLIDDSMGVLGNKYLAMLGIPPETEAIKGDYGELRYDVTGKPKLVVWRSPWNMGVPDAFNMGVALSSNNLVFMLGSDDKMMPDCLNECVASYTNKKIEGWYATTYITQSGKADYIPNNCAMVTKKLWSYLGGFPPSAGVGGCDAVCLSILMAHDSNRIILVKQGTPLCWLREHPDQDTRRNAWLFSGEIVSIRNKETERWLPKSRP